MFKILASYLLGLTIQNLVITFLGFLFASFGIPYLLLVVFSIKNGLPVFDAVEAFGKNSAMFAIICCVLTVVIIIFLLIPGLVWSLDSSVRNTAWFVQDEFGNEEYWLRLRWGLSFFPGVFSASLIILIFSSLNSDSLIKTFGKQVFISTTSLIIFVLVGGHVVFRAGWMGKKLGQARPKFLKYRLVFRRPSNFLMTNVVASVFFVVYAAISYKFVEQLNANDGRASGIALLNTIFTVLTSASFLLMSSVWVIKLDIWKAAGAVLGAAMIVFSFWPGFPALLQSYMSMMRVGGGTEVLVTLDIDVTKNWADFYKIDVERSSDKFVRVGPLSLVLLGKKKVFFRLRSTDDPNGFQGPIMLDRSQLGGMLFLDKK